VGQWLQVRNLASVGFNNECFQRFSRDLRVSMERETELLFEHILRDDKNILDFLDANYTYANQRLADFYGIPGVTGSEFRKVSLEGTARRGVLSHGSILALTSNPTRTSPVKRGKWVLESLLGTPPPAPPANVPPLPDDRGKEGRKLKGSLR